MLILLPGRCHHHALRTETIRLEYRCNVIGQLLQIGIDETTAVRADKETVLTRLHNTDVIRGLHGSLHHLTHLDNTLRRRFQTLRQCLKRLWIDDGRLFLTDFDPTMHVRIVVAKGLLHPFVQHCLLQLHEHRRLSRHTELQVCRRGNRCIRLANLDLRHTEVKDSVDGLQEIPHNHRRTDASFVDIHT